MIHSELWKQLLELDPADVCLRSGAEMTDAGMAFRLPVLNERYCVDCAARTVCREDGTDEKQSASFHLHLSAVNYLIRAQDAPLAGELVSAKQFPTGPLFFRGPHELPAKKLEDRFGSDRAAFESAGLALGGRRVDHGDAAVELALFPRLPITVVLWLEDDEFPARVSYLFDRTADQHLLLDGLWSATHVARDALLAAAEGNDG